MVDPDMLRTLGDVARQQATARGAAPAFVFEGRSTSYAAFDRHTNRIANAMIAWGLKPGDRIAYVGKNSDWFFELIFGANKAGAVMTPVNWRVCSAVSR